MKKLITLPVLIVVCMVLAVLSCRKEEAPLALSVSPATENLKAEITAALKGYENSFNKGRLQTLLSTLAWNRVYTKTVAGRNYSFIALTEPMKGIGFKTGQYREYLQFSGSTETGYRLELVSVHAGNAQAFFERGYQPAEAKHPRKELGEAFTGTVNIYRLSSFDLDISYYYQDGELKNSKTLKSNGEGIRKVQSLAVVECTDWWLETVYYINGTPVVTETTYLYRTCSGICEEQTTFAPGANFESLPKVMCGGGGVHTDYINAQQDLPEVQNNLQDSCLRASLQALMNNSINNRVKNILDSVFGEQSNLSLSFEDVTSLPDSVNGYFDITRSQQTTTTYGTFTKLFVLVNKNKLPQATKEYTTITYLHEAIHAYLYLTQKNYLLDHETTAFKYRGAMAQIVKSMYGISQDQADAIAWMGLFETAAWQTFKNNHIHDGEIQKVLNINTAFRNGSSGTTCN